MSENGDCFWSFVLGWSKSKTPGSSLTLLVMCIRSPPIQVANNGLNYCTFRLQVGERKKKTPLGSSLLVKANFKWFILSKKQQLHATSEDQITVFQRRTPSSRNLVWNRNPGGQSVSHCQTREEDWRRSPTEWEWGSPREQTDSCLPGHKFPKK